MGTPTDTSFDTTGEPRTAQILAFRPRRPPIYSAVAIFDRRDVFDAVYEPIIDGTRGGGSALRHQPIGWRGF